jgi:uncharacterized membrane protein
MRKALEAVSLIALAAMAFVTIRAFYGPARLPDRIPTHFNAAGQADGWGPPHMLLVFPIIATVIYLLMTLVSRFPAAFNFPVRATPLNRQQLEELALSMIAWLKAEMVMFFGLIEDGAIRSARQPDQHLSPLLMPVLLVAVFTTCIAHIVAMFKAGR